MIYNLDALAYAGNLENLSDIENKEEALLSAEKYGKSGYGSYIKKIVE